MSASVASAQSSAGGPLPSSTFTYQGQLQFQGQAVTETCDFTFRLFDAEMTGAEVAPPVSISSVSVVDGVFSVPLDFGQSAFNAQPRWLGIEVTCPNGGTPVVLSPRQSITRTPRAIHADLSAGLVGGEQDPVFSSSPAATIQSANIADWDEAHSWGDHQAAGYLTSEADGDPSNELQTLNATDFNVAISGGNSVVVGDQGWDLGAGGAQWSTNTGNLGIGTTTPDNKLDVNGKISLSQSPGDEMVIINDDLFTHGTGLQDFGTGGAHFFIASRENDFETAGIYGDGNVVSIWSPGDANNGQPSALVYFMDEDRFDEVDTNPHNNNALYAYISAAGNFVSASDARRKENIQRLSGTLDRLMQVNAYRYQHRLIPEEIEKGQIAEPTLGFMAQELERYFPEVVEKSDDGDYYVSYMELVPVLVEALKEQQAQVRQAESSNQALEARLLELEQRLATLEAE